MSNRQGTVKILGIDPGLRCTGFGVIALQHNQPIYIASGQIRTQKTELALRLTELFTAVQSIIDTYDPQVSVIEKVFVNVNAQSTLLLGQARGALIASLVYRRLAVYEYTALQLKQAVVGYGKAAKSQVQEMVKRLLQLEVTPSTDAADALAVALCHVYHQQLQKPTQSKTISSALAKQLGSDKLIIRRGRIVMSKA